MYKIVLSENRKSCMAKLKLNISCDRNIKISVDQMKEEALRKRGAKIKKKAFKHWKRNKILNSLKVK